MCGTLYFIIVIGEPWCLYGLTEALTYFPYLHSLPSPSLPPSQAPPAKPEGEEDWPFLREPWLKPDKITDRQRRRPDHPEYDPRTLYVPDLFLSQQTPVSTLRKLGNGWGRSTRVSNVAGEVWQGCDCCVLIVPVLMVWQRADRGGER